MKKYYFFIIIGILFFGFANAQIANIPNGNFKNVLLGDAINQIWLEDLAGNDVFSVDFNQDGQIQISEALQISRISLGNSTGITSIVGIEYFTNLRYLDFSFNYIQQNLNLTALINLKELNAMNTAITGLNVSGLTFLEKIDCFGTGFLSSINLTNLPNLTWLWVESGPIQTLDLSGCPNVTALYLFSLPNITTVIFAPNRVIQGFICQGTNMSSLDNFVNLNPLSTSFYFGSNKFTNLDFSNFPNLVGINLTYETQLTSVNIKNGIDGGLSLQGCTNLDYICVDEGIEFLNVLNEINAVNLTCNVNSYCSFSPGGDFYTVQGISKYDLTNNGCDVSDINFPNLKLDYSGANGNGVLIPNASGNFFLTLQEGSHTITPLIENPAYFSVSPTSVSVDFPTTTSPAIRDFCVTANGVHNDLEIVMIPLTAARPGFDTKYKLIYKNKGNQTQSGAVNLTFNDAVLDLVIANPLTSSQALNDLSWNFANLQPFETREILVTLNLNTPLETPPVNAGFVLNYTAIIASATDETPLDNSSTLNQIVVNSFDPNDKTCLEGATITPSQVGKEVHYVIHFENTGTANAQNIVVKDMIDTSKFDVNSLIPISGSHSFVTRITETNKVEFIFENIQLPFNDANNDGYVAFKIKTKPTLVSGDTFSNTASIYFDYNFPIVTDPATTTVSNVLANQDFEFDNFISINPNPAKEILAINSQNIKVSSISIYNTLGQLVQVIPNAKETKTIDVSQLKSGNYFIQVVSDKGASSSKFIKE